MTKLYIKNALKRSQRARLMLVSRYKVRRPFRWFGLGSYKIDPTLVGNIGGSILVAKLPAEEICFWVTAFEKLEFEGPNTSQGKIFDNMLPAVIAILMCSTLQYIVWQMLNSYPVERTWGMVSFSFFIVLVAVLRIMPKIFQIPPDSREFEKSFELMKTCETNTHAARTKCSVAAIFPSRALRYPKIYLILLACASWFLIPIFSDFNSRSFAFYSSQIPGIAMGVLVLNDRILSHEVSWVLNAEYLRIHSNIWFGPSLEIPSSEVLGLVIEKGRLRIEFSSREDFSLFIGLPTEVLIEAVDWTNQLIENKEKGFKHDPGSRKRT